MSTLRCVCFVASLQGTLIEACPSASLCFGNLVFRVIKQAFHNVYMPAIQATYTRLYKATTRLQAPSFGTVSFSLRFGRACVLRGSLSLSLALLA